MPGKEMEAPSPPEDAAGEGRGLAVVTEQLQ